MSVPVLILHIRVSVENHQTALFLQIPHHLGHAILRDEKLSEALDKVQRELLEELMDKHMTLSAGLECDAFTRGIRFGVRMMMEIFGAEDSQNL